MYGYVYVYKIVKLLSFIINKKNYIPVKLFICIFVM